MTDIIERLRQCVTMKHETALVQEAANEIALLRANITMMEAAARDAIEIVRKEQKAKLASLLQEIDYGRFHGWPSETLQRLEEMRAAMKDKP